MIKIWRKGIRGSVHFTSPLLDACGAMTRISGNPDTHLLSSFREIHKNTAFVYGKTYDKLCKRCRRNMENFVSENVVVSAQGSDNGEMPSLDEIATEAPLPVIPHISTLSGALTHVVTWTFEGNTFDAFFRSLESAETRVSGLIAEGAQDVKLEELAAIAERVANAPAKTREAWLLAAVKELTAVFEEHGYTVPPVRISVGWPGGKGKKTMLKTIGQCWHKESAADGVPQIFITPNLIDLAEILETIAHELVHAVCGPGVGHKAGFKAIAVKIGLEGKKMTATRAGDALRAKFAGMLERLGTYDHAKLSVSTETSAANRNRHLKMSCQHCEFTARTTRKQMDEYSMPEHCGAEMYEA